MLVEELESSSYLIHWFLEYIGCKEKIKSSKVLHSKRRTLNRREIDIHLEIYTFSNDKPIVLLIENKLDANEQPDQAESYNEEAYIIKNDCNLVATILICPDDYRNIHSGFASKFGFVICYEEIINALKKRILELDGELKNRVLFRIKLLEQGLYKYRRGYMPVPNKVIGEFNKRYVLLLAKLAPQITAGESMLKPANPNESVSMIFDHNKSLSFLPENIRPSRFAIEFGKNDKNRANYVAVVFKGWGNYFEEIKEQLYLDTIDYGFEFAAKKPNKSRPNSGLVMSIETYPIDNQDDFENQKHYLEMGIKAALRLRSWLFNNQDKLQKWYKLTVEQGA